MLTTSWVLRWLSDGPMVALVALLADASVAQRQVSQRVRSHVDGAIKDIAAAHCRRVMQWLRS